MVDQPELIFDFKIDRSSVVPVFLQIVRHVNCIIRGRQLKDGYPIPRIRALATKLKVNPNTVAKSYEQLESIGLIVKKRGSGCVVGSLAPRSSLEGDQTHLNPQIDELLCL